MSEQKDASGKEKKTPPKVQGTKRPTAVAPSTSAHTIKKRIVPDPSMRSKAGTLIRKIINQKEDSPVSHHEHLLDLMDESPDITIEDLFLATGRLKDPHNKAEMAKGIAQALLTTALGLMIAIPISVMETFFTNKSDAYYNDFEDVLSETAHSHGNAVGQGREPLSR